MDYTNIPDDMHIPGMLTKTNSMRPLDNQYSLPADFLKTGAYHNNPTPADIGKPMYYSNGFFIGHFQGVINTANGPRVTYSRNEELLRDAWNPQMAYVQNKPLFAAPGAADGGGGSVASVRRGGKSRRKHTKKTRRGRKTRRQRRR
jgi:hypothetical protein